MGKTVSLALAVTSGVLIAIGSAAGASGATTPKHTVHMKGALEIPKGSAKGKGTFVYQIVLTKNVHELCYSLKWSGIGTPVAAHVHKGLKGVEGPIVIPLSTKAPVAQSGCVKAKKALLLAIEKKPTDYYVNIHNKKYPAGALRGQL